ncbi:MAG TPA: response regulator [Terriglobales bacterium]|nr:response regulator [Terriglobales bacterium]
MQSTKTRVLFVDDEAGIRLTLPHILENEGFVVSVAASVPEALEIMNHQAFDVLLTDLNIGAPADGFILVSAMRKIQPGTATFILTGYPDFQTALEAIRKQVDDYFVKPADIPMLVSTLKEKVHRPRELCQTPCKRLSTVILENSNSIIERWLREASEDKRLNSQISKGARVDHFPDLLLDLANVLAKGAVLVPQESLTAAAVHGVDRAQQGYTIPQLIAETRLLHRAIAACLQENLLSMDLSALIPDSFKIGEYLQALLEESIRAFQEEGTFSKPKSRVAAATAKERIRARAG